ncbi:hypothetical protein N7519_008872 [Penicillium mononematosum]|uniref:uncharacterized protein n=1 Tax=Penicillium mononematosum TaxID=268346 RepID=UPI0025476EA8|nr:uncharacterized protein N7519_008872 [Penicillium mononematosum]KAJ6178411.1 hypothetical protein N7519_008872 [Penicillium mononematosum]
MAGGVQMGPCQVIAGSQCGFLLADGASVLDSLSEVQEPIDVKWAFCLLVPPRVSKWRTFKWRKKKKDLLPGGLG